MEFQSLVDEICRCGVKKSEPFLRFTQRFVEFWRVISSSSLNHWVRGFRSTRKESLPALTFSATTMSSWIVCVVVLSSALSLVSGESQGKFHASFTGEACVVSAGHHIH